MSQRKKGPASMKKIQAPSLDEILLLAILIAYFAWAIYDIKAHGFKVIGTFAQATEVAFNYA